MKRAIKNHASDFAAILVLLVLSVVVAGYILGHERFRFPFIESSPIKMNAEFSIPGSNTLPDLNVDEILSSLDSNTRAYLDLLVNGAGQGLKGKAGGELAQVLERFEPTHRDLARLNQAVAARGANLRRLVNSLRRLNGALFTKQAQIVQLIDSSSKVFRAFASEDHNVSRAIADLPATLRQT